LEVNRRTFLFLAPVATVLLTRCGTAAVAPAEDVEYVRALERAQRDRPTALRSDGRIAPPAEPGTPLVIHGQVFRADGRTPAPGIVVFAYHADAGGRYDAPSAGPHSWRLRGWAKTDADGRFEFRTIRPAPYPGRRVAAHVHLSLEGPGVARQFGGLMFAGDPLLSEAERRESAQAGRFGTIRPVEKRAGAEHVALAVRLGR
jgi:protocatechuate 3,4-dioxygenase beta subunit